MVVGVWGWGSRSQLFKIYFYRESSPKFLNRTKLFLHSSLGLCRAVSFYYIYEKNIYGCVKFKQRMDFYTQYNNSTIKLVFGRLLGLLKADVLVNGRCCMPIPGYCSSCWPPGSTDTVCSNTVWPHNDHFAILYSSSDL